MLPRLPSALRKRRATIKRKSYGLLLSVQQSLLDKGSTATINLLLPLRCWELHSQEVGRKVRRLASLRITGFLSVGAANPADVAEHVHIIPGFCQEALIGELEVAVLRQLEEGLRPGRKIVNSWSKRSLWRSRHREHIQAGNGDGLSVLGVHRNRSSSGSCRWRRSSRHTGTCPWRGCWGRRSLRQSRRSWLPPVSRRWAALLGQPGLQSSGAPHQPWRSQHRSHGGRHLLIDASHMDASLRQQAIQLSIGTAAVDEIKELGHLCDRQRLELVREASLRPDSLLGLTWYTHLSMSLNRMSLLPFN